MWPLYPQGESLTGSLALALPQAAEDGAELELSYQVTELERYFAHGGSSEAVEGAFSGRAAITVDTSHNRTVEDFESNGTVEINWVEATPLLHQDKLHHPLLGEKRTALW